jgi:hypothetical protein
MAPWLYSDWGTTKAGAWMRNNAWTFGFVMSYTEGQEPFGDVLQVRAVALPLRRQGDSEGDSRIRVDTSRMDLAAPDRSPRLI